MGLVSHRYNHHRGIRRLGLFYRAWYCRTSRVCDHIANWASVHWHDYPLDSPGPALKEVIDSNKSISFSQANVKFHSVSKSIKGEEPHV